MWPFKNKYDKLTREEVVDAICKLEQESSNIEENLLSAQKRIDDLVVKGKQEKSKEVKLFYAKKINALKAEREQSVRRYNIQLLQKLKTAIDDNQFFKNTSNTSLGNLLADQKGLAKFLNKTLGVRIAAEDVLTSADETFRAVEDAYEQNETIYGMNSQDDELLAMFETEEQVDAEQEMFTTHPEKKTSSADDKGGEE